MLVLTRKTGQTITIDGDITVQVVQVRGRQVRLGIDAPKIKKVQRGELSAIPLRKKPFSPAGSSATASSSPAVKNF